MDRYQRVEKPKPESPINENEIRITTQGVIRNYISYATTLLQRVREIVLKAMGQAISKTVAIAEIIKKRIPRLHQDTAISSVSITDVWEPIEEGLVPVEMTRHVSMISITLSTKELNKNSPGYQAPYNVEPSKPLPNNQQPQQPKQARIPYNAIHIIEDEDVVEVEGGAGTGVDMATIKVDMEAIKVGMAVIKVDMGAIKVGMVTIKVDMATIKEDMETIKVDMEVIKITVDIQIEAEVVGEAGVGAIVVQDMREAGVVVVEGMAVAEDEQVAAQGEVATRHKQATGVLFWDLAKCLPLSCGR
ncbi:hypothetical protein FEM48_Zijuj09G0073500 [Ziziphus jujuba var. spinosa]|uniref:DNA/RNA-binding protein Alba-like domain-containing protein n=1 Tax=Ziziphus jujuba var. spinosa TaxID=714518 RepID=A0A978URM0_ZIZJJ|nr:hypothetical protein FEM48_Zijuj09G0073500 [Ziziphus jujuba var. spinosa]